MMHYGTVGEGDFNQKLQSFEKRNSPHINYNLKI